MKAILRNIEKYKSNKFYYYSLNFARQFVPQTFFHSLLDTKLCHIKNFNINYISERVNYYNRLNDFNLLPAETQALNKFTQKKKLKTFFFDTFEYTCNFPDRKQIHYCFKDIATTPPIPCIVESRPINSNEFGVLLALNKTNKAGATKDSTLFDNKIDMLVGRMSINQAHRLQFLEMYAEHYLCNVGQNEKKENKQFIKPNLSFEEQLKYKFILCLEGKTVSSTLKKVMSSNSVAVMPRPKFESWFMEGTLIPNVHYIEIKDDYSDLEQRLQYYIKHTQAAKEIIQNANSYAQQFMNIEQENIIELLVLEKYCYLTKQKNLNEHCFDFFANNKSAHEVARLIV